MATEDLSKKVVLITGCSSGFGLITAVEMARAGFHVFASMRNLNKRADLEAAAFDAKVSFDIIELDVTKSDSIASAIAEVERKAGPVDILVNNAGYMVQGCAEEVDMNDLQQLMDTNFFGLVNMTKAVIPKMRERRTGHIINISSLSGLIGIAGSSAYCASKFAVEGYMECLRYEGILDGYYVSNIEPGQFNTPLFSNWRRVLNPGSPHYQITQGVINFFENNLKNAADPHDVAKLVIKIAKDKKPRFRYPIGKEKMYLLLKACLPGFIFEKLIMKGIKDAVGKKR